MITHNDHVIIFCLRLLADYLAGLGRHHFAISTTLFALTTAIKLFIYFFETIIFIHVFSITVFCTHHTAFRYLYSR